MLSNKKNIEKQVKVILQSNLGKHKTSETYPKLSVINPDTNEVEA